MSVVEDVRKVMQDFIAPEMREFKVRMDAQEKRLDSIDARLDQLRSELKEHRSAMSSGLKEVTLDFDRQSKDLRMEMLLGFREVQQTFKELRSDLRISERVEKLERTISAEQKH